VKIWPGFVSLKYQLVLFSGLVMLALGATLSIIITQELQQDFYRNQEERYQQIKAEFDLLVAGQASKLEVISTSSLLGQPGSQISPDTLQKKFESQWADLQLMYELHSIALFNESGQMTFTIGQPNPFDIVPQVRRVERTLRPDYWLWCLNDCRLFSAVPFLFPDGEVGSLVLSSTLVDVALVLRDAFNIDLALLTSNDPVTAEPASGSTVHISTHPEMVNALLATPQVQPLLSKPDDFQELVFRGSDKMLWHLPLKQPESSRSGRHLLLLIDDVSTAKADILALQWQIITVVLISMVTIAAITVLLAWRPVSKILQSSMVMSLLARSDFEQARLTLPTPATWLGSEIDVLCNASRTLTIKLESMERRARNRTQALRHMAMYDSLTGLPNRNYFQDELKAALKHAAQHQTAVAVFFCDLDNFKDVNDALGHEAGDQLLNEMARTLQNSLCENATLCRFGGDEFTCIVHSLGPDDDSITLTLNSLLEALRTPIMLAHSTITPSASIGVAVSRGEITSNELVRRADIAMYEAKHGGGDRFRIFNDEMSELIAKRFTIESCFRRAVIDGQLELHYQPKICCRTLRLTGFEALVRWIHPQLGFLPPNEFIPILEKSELINELGRWVVTTATARLDLLRQNGYGQLDMAINISSKQLSDPQLFRLVEQTLEHYPQLRPEQLELEVTENTLIENLEQAHAQLKQLKRLGVRIAMDDFGTGYSSLSYLSKLQMDTIKLDKSLVDKITESRSDKIILGNIIKLLGSLQRETVAEGVETREQLVLLQQMQCDRAQGYLISRPIPEKQLRQTLATRFPEGIWQEAHTLIPSGS